MGIVRILMGVYVGSYKKEEKLALSCKGEFGTIGWCVVMPETCLKIHYFQTN